MSAETIRWVLNHTGNHVVCTERAENDWIEVRVSYNNLPIAHQRYTRAEDAAIWVEQVRAQWQGVAEPTAQVAAATTSVADALTVRILSAPLDTGSLGTA